MFDEQVINEEQTLTQEQTKSLQVIANHANKSEIASWNRKRKSIERVITSNIRPLEDQLIEINTKLMPLYDQLGQMRKEMVEYCVHPIDMLLHEGTHISCKFCFAKLAVPTHIGGEYE